MDQNSNDDNLWQLSLQDNDDDNYPQEIFDPLDYTFAFFPLHQFVMESPPELILNITNKFYLNELQYKLCIRVTTTLNGKLYITQLDNTKENLIKFNINQFFDSIKYEEIKSQDIQTQRTIVASNYLRENFNQKMNIEIFRQSTGLKIYLISKSNKNLKQITHQFTSIFRGTRIFLNSEKLISKYSPNSLLMKVRLKYFKKFYQDYLFDQINSIQFIEVVNEYKQFISILIGCLYENNSNNSSSLQLQLTNWIINSLKSLFYFTITSNSLQELRKLENILNNTKFENQILATSLIDEGALIVIGKDKELIKLFDILIEQRFQLDVEDIEIQIYQKNVDYNINYSQNNFQISAWPSVKIILSKPQIKQISQDNLQISFNCQSDDLIFILKDKCCQKYIVIGYQNENTLDAIMIQLKKQMCNEKNNKIFDVLLQRDKNEELHKKMDPIIDEPKQQENQKNKTFQNTIIQKIYGEKGKCKVSDEYTIYFKEKISKLKNNQFTHLFVKITKTEALQLNSFSEQLNYYNDEQIILKYLNQGEAYLEVLVQDEEQRINVDLIFSDTQNPESMSTFQLHSNSVFPIYMHVKQQK